MTRVLSLRVQGYRAISEPVVLGDLGPYVALYGDNAVGKSSVLKALALLSRLCATDPMQLLGSGRPWPPEAFFERYGQDPWMFNADSAGSVTLAAVTDAGLDVSFTLRQVPDGIDVTCTRAMMGATDLAAEVVAAQEALTQIDPFAPSELTDKANARLSEAYARLGEAQSTFNVAVGASPVVPVPDEVRAALFGGMTSPQAAVRTTVRSVLRRFRELFPALGDGEMDTLATPPDHKPDLAWVTTDRVLPLDHLGGGVQSVVATLASLLLARAAVVCLEEPEAFVGNRALQGLAGVFRGAAAAKICDQVWIATHAVNLVGAEDPIVVLDRDCGIVSARQGKAASIGGRFAQAPPETSADRVGRLGHDGSVRLPRPLVERAGLRPGDFVYFVDDGTGARILTGEQMDATLPESEEP